jgi:hypothetical protein
LEDNDDDNDDEDAEDSSGFSSDSGGDDGGDDDGSVNDSDASMAPPIKRRRSVLGAIGSPFCTHFRL